MPQHTIKFNDSFALEAGGVLPSLTVAYNTWGELNATGTNVIWICHALTANADAEQWWPGMIGEGLVFNPSTHYIVCANILGSCYGTTGPTEINPNTNKVYGKDFPLVTIRDMVRVHQLLSKHLGVQSIELLAGGSLGGHQALEWAISQPSCIKNLVLIASSARHSAWGIAFNEAQRMALDLGEKGIETARAIAMLSYRNYHMYTGTQTDDNEKYDTFKAATYQRYQGEKLRLRFDADSYYTLSKAMDSHNVGRGRENVEQALQHITAKTVVIGISSDQLFPPHEQELIAAHINGAKYYTIDSPYGHDGFLIETEKVSSIINSNGLLQRVLDKVAVNA